MLRLTERQTTRLWRDASTAWHGTGPHAAWEVFRDAGALVLWPTWYRTVTRRARGRYLSAIETASQPRLAKITGEGRSQYQLAGFNGQRRAQGRQKGHRPPGARGRKP